MITTQIIDVKLQTTRPLQILGVKAEVAWVLDAFSIVARIHVADGLEALRVAKVLEDPPLSLSVAYHIRPDGGVLRLRPIVGRWHAVARD